MHDRDESPPGGEGRERRAPTLRLDDALKLAGLAATGGQAKHRIQAGEVTVNGAVETRRKRLLRPGDVIALDGETYEIDLEPDDDDAGGDAEHDRDDP
jgi:ribosome-associated protein